MVIALSSIVNVLIVPTVIWIGVSLIIVGIIVAIVIVIALAICIWLILIVILVVGLVLLLLLWSRISKALRVKHLFKSSK